MAYITGKPNLFFFTSPRSPYKMKDEIRVLVENFAGQRWSSNPILQTEFFTRLAGEEFFTGSLSGNLDLKGRDRITRAPKSLGLVDLTPVIALTDAGREYIYGKRPQELFIRQLLKFQLPSPYHIDKEGTFFIKPYLELLRLVYELKELSKDEIAAFVIQLTHINKYEWVKNKILSFREKRAKLDRQKTNYRRFFENIFEQEIQATYQQQLLSGEISLREARNETISSSRFIKTKRNNHVDYADAAIRYLRETGLVTLRSNRSSVIYIPSEKIAEVQFILDSTPREPIFIQSQKQFKAYLFNPSLPVLFSDDKPRLVQTIQRLSPGMQGLDDLTLEELKDLQEELAQLRLKEQITQQVQQLQSYKEYADIEATYDDIKNRRVLDAPLLMEWNTWRAFVMLDDGEVEGNFRFDEFGLPLTVAAGNQADIVCSYNDFDLLIEVTLSTGATQYKMESEPVPRHLGLHKKEKNRETYAVFIAGSLNPATIAHFFVLHRLTVDLYGGTAKIIPLSIADFRMMLAIANAKEVKPSAIDVRSFVQQASQLALQMNTETEWYQQIQQLVQRWIPERKA